MEPQKITPLNRKYLKKSFKKNVFTFQMSLSQVWFRFDSDLIFKKLSTPLGFEWCEIYVSSGDIRLIRQGRRTYAQLFDDIKLHNLANVSNCYEKYERAFVKNLDLILWYSMFHHCSICLFAHLTSTSTACLS